jgi:starch synthase (maltosyl-transferring)
MIGAVRPQIEGGRYFIKRIVGESIQVEADVLADGHDVQAACVLFRHEGDNEWQSSPMWAIGDDRFMGRFTVDKQGFYSYKVRAWVDHALTWQHGLERKAQDGQHVDVELLDGVQYLDRLLALADKKHHPHIHYLQGLFADHARYGEAVREALSERLHQLFLTYPTQNFATESDGDLRVYVDRERALFSTWYEFFPRSASSEVGKHGTFKDCERIIPRIAKMGFDVLYFPPIHPIGEVNRKGKNNATNAGPNDVGSPWGIGSHLGGHKDVHPELGTLQDFRDLIEMAKNYGIEIAMDYALQCAPDHPYVKAHPQWFKWRPDGSVQYAENPPKKYQDILPIYFETEDWQNLWNELLSIVLFWAEQGIRILRVDNPHTKPFAFWEWLIAEVKKQYPDMLFLAEAFTRPKIMHQLAKVGFTQSYTYYSWRSYRQEIIDYMLELSHSEGAEYFRPNFWPNTPDINPFSLQSGREPIFLTRLFMAATLSSSYGIYGPVFEYMVHDALLGKEEYRNSEKYEIYRWDWDKTNKLTHLIAMLNHFRRENKALQQTRNLHICQTDNDSLFAYFKSSSDGSSQMLMVVNLDPYNRRAGWVQLPLHLLGVSPGSNLFMHDLISQSTYTWQQEWNYVELSPSAPFHLFQIRRPQVYR